MSGETSSGARVQLSDLQRILSNIHPAGFFSLPYQLNLFLLNFDESYMFALGCTMMPDAPEDPDEGT